MAYHTLDHLLTVAMNDVIGIYQTSTLQKCCVTTQDRYCYFSCMADTSLAKGATAIPSACPYKSLDTSLAKGATAIPSACPYKSLDTSLAKGATAIPSACP